MGIFKDLTGLRFGRLVVIEIAENLKHNIRWRTVCDCGKEILVVGGSLTSGNTKSCGCLKREVSSARLRDLRDKKRGRILNDLTGQRFGLWVVRNRVITESKKTLWVVNCDCGVQKIVCGWDLTKGNSRSCGCIRDQLKSKAMEKKYDLLNQRFGRLLVLRRSSKRHEHSRVIRWECKCDCGKTVTVDGVNLRGGWTKSCGCFRRDKICLPPGLCGFNSLFAGYKKSAQDRRLKWELSEDKFKGIVSGNCYYCGRPPQQISVKTSPNGKFFYNGVDRLDNLVGYIEGNVVSCCGTHNYMKGTLSYQEFITACSQVIEHLSLKG